MNKLPGDALAKIFSFLSPGDHAHAAQSCTLFSTCARYPDSNYNYLCEKVRVTTSSKHLTADTLTTLCSINPNPISVHLDISTKDYSLPLGRYLLLQSWQPTCLTLNLESKKETEALLNILCSENLSSLTLARNDGNDYNEEKQYDVAPNCLAILERCVGTLQCLQIQGCSFNPALLPKWQVFVELTMLCLSDPEYICTSAQDNLRFLFLLLQNTDVITLAKHCPNLQQLEAAFSEEAISELNRFPALVELHVFCNTPGEVCATRIPSWTMQRLQCLSSDIPMEYDDFQQLTGCPLQHIALRQQYIGRLFDEGTFDSFALTLESLNIDCSAPTQKIELSNLFTGDDDRSDDDDAEWTTEGDSFPQLCDLAPISRLLNLKFLRILLKNNPRDNIPIASTIHSFDDTCFEHLRTLRNLEVFHFAGIDTHITAAGITHIVDLPLTRLNLSCNKVTEGAVRKLAELQTLKFLSLCRIIQDDFSIECKISTNSSAMAPLLALPCLENLHEKCCTSTELQSAFRDKLGANNYMRYGLGE